MKWLQPFLVKFSVWQDDICWLEVCWLTLHPSRRQPGQAYRLWKCNICCLSSPRGSWRRRRQVTKSSKNVWKVKGWLVELKTLGQLKSNQVSIGRIADDLMRAVNIIAYCQRENQTDVFSPWNWPFAHCLAWKLPFGKSIKQTNITNSTRGGTHRNSLTIKDLSNLFEAYSSHSHGFSPLHRAYDGFYGLWIVSPMHMDFHGFMAYDVCSQPALPSSSQVDMHHSTVIQTRQSLG